MSNDNVIDFKTKKNMSETDPELNKPTNFEFHFFPEQEGLNGEVVTAKGFLKFGPQFIAVTESPEDTSLVVLAFQANALKYVKRLGEDTEVQATLSF